jgi:acetyltransferase-like isoleucine patch superfamily enzyme
VAVKLGRFRDLSVDRLRRKLAAERRSRLIAAGAARVFTPPPPHAFRRFGENSLIVPPARIESPEAIEIGDRVVVHEHAWFSVVKAFDDVEPRLVIDDDVLIDRLCHIACVGEIVIGRRVSIGERSLIGDTFHRYDDVTTPVIDQPLARPRKVTIEAGAHLGLASLIVPGVTVGEQAFVGAGAVVTRDVPPRTLVVGNPARPVKRYDEERAAWVDCA